MRFSAIAAFVAVVLSHFRCWEICYDHQSILLSDDVNLFPLDEQSLAMTAAEDDREISFPIYITSNATILELDLRAQSLPVNAALKAQQSRIEISIDAVHTDLADNAIGILLLVLPSTALLVLFLFLARRLGRMSLSHEIAGPSSSSWISTSSSSSSWISTSSSISHSISRSISMLLARSMTAAPPRPSAPAWPVHCVWCARRCECGFFCPSCGAPLVFPDPRATDDARQKAWMNRNQTLARRGSTAPLHEGSSVMEIRNIVSPFTPHVRNPASDPRSSIASAKIPIDSGAALTLNQNDGDDGDDGDENVPLIAARR
eukprot:TRINITY_DN9320_c0_g1_i10.p1 TRINITY_DN9320_c0_g1~~TRINITY_DN9320_c0_g1_i10.p1  ORF type:complete len:317 (-),score=61.75 TRINITY_DN9320_c0_g1_i10:140-1090(-)